MKKLLFLLLSILLAGCSSIENETSSESPVYFAPAVNEVVLKDFEFPYEIYQINWPRDDTILIIGQDERENGKPQPLAEHLFLYRLEENRLIPIDLSSVKNFSYPVYWSGLLSYNSSEVYLRSTVSEGGRPFHEHMVVKIPIDHMESSEVAQYKEYFEEYRSTPSEQGKYIRSPKPVASNRFTIVDVFSGEEIDAQTDLLYQMEAAEISPDLMRLFIHHPAEDSHTLPWYHGETGRLEGGSPEGFTGVFSMENGELLYLKSTSEQNGILHWSQSGNYLLDINYDVEKNSFSVQVCRADDGKFLWEKSFEKVRWRTHYLAGDFLYCISTIGKTLTLLDLSTGEIATTDFSDPVEEVGVSPDGTKAAVYQDGKIKVISLDQ